jgi:membrane protease YdiL (CAAX protease family)
MLPTHSSLFVALRGRFLLGTFVLTGTIPWIIVEVIWPDWVSSEAMPLIEALMGVGSYILIFAIIMIAAYRTGLMDQFSVAIGPVPPRNEVLDYALLSIPLIAISLVGMYLLYLPLSYSFPEFVTWWFLEEPSMIWWSADIYSITASIINAILIIIMAPILEELIFRGFLLNRWQAKYGTVKAIIFSSLIFGLLHVEILGGVIFGALLCLIYLKTNSLIGPIIVHMANNAIAVLIMVSEGIWTGEIANTTMDEFHSEWWWAIIGATVGIPWLYSYTKKLLESFPKISPIPETTQT